MTELHPHPGGRNVGDDVAAMRRLRDQLVHDVDVLRTWRDLLRHKAAALRALTSAAASRSTAAQVTPGQLDLGVVAAALSQRPSFPDGHRFGNSPRRAGWSEIPAALSEVPAMLAFAAEIWEETAPPSDPARALALAVRSERHAGLLEWRERHDRRRLWTTNREIAVAMVTPWAPDEPEDLDLLAGSLASEDDSPWA